MRVDMEAVVRATRRAGFGLARATGGPAGLVRRSRTLVAALIVAASAGTVASLVASVVLGPLGDQVLARDGWSNRAADGLLDSGGSGYAPAPAQSAAPLPAPSWTESARRTPRARLAQASPRRPWAVRGTVRLAASTTQLPSGHHSVCVRLCDGFFFPVGDVHGANDLDTQTAVCSNACPGAPTRLFVVPSDERDMGKAVGVPTGKLYTELPVAYAHANAVGPTCTCHAAGGAEAALDSPLRDITMRDGDSVMTAVGWRVFKGNGHWPYTRQNYSTLAAATGLPPQTRTTLAALESATLGRIGAAPPGAVVLDIRKKKTPLDLKDADGHVVRLNDPASTVIR